MNKIRLLSNFLGVKYENVYRSLLEKNANYKLIPQEELTDEEYKNILLAELKLGEYNENIIKNGLVRFEPKNVHLLIWKISVIYKIDKDKIIQHIIENKYTSILNLLEKMIHFN